MSGFGGIISFQAHGGREKAFEVVSRLKIIVRATSLGGPVSLIEHPDDLIEDLGEALDSGR